MSATRDFVHVAGRSLFQDVDPTFWMQTLGPETETCLPRTHAQTLKTWCSFPEGREEYGHLARSHVCAVSAPVGSPDDALANFDQQASPFKPQYAILATGRPIPNAVHCSSIASSWAMFSMTYQSSIHLKCSNTR